MKRTKCYSVRIKSIKSISEKAYLITAFDGSEAVFPKSAVFGDDYSRSGSQSIWIASWILAKKDLQCSKKKEAWFDSKGKMLPSYTVKTHKPKKIEAQRRNEVEELKR